MIKDAICCKKVFVVLDGVDKLDQLDALLGVQGWLFSGSKIIITTRRERLLGAYEFYKVHRLQYMSHEESLELVSWHAFGKCCPNNGYEEVSKRVGKSEIEGLKLDTCLLKEEAYACTIFGDNRKRRYEGFLGKPLLSNLGGSLKRCGFSIFSSHLVPTSPENSNLMALEADAFAGMNKLKLMHLNHVHINGPYKKFPKGLRWLCWRGFPLQSIPGDFPLESLVALDMQYSHLKNVWEGTRFLQWCQILNLSHSHNLAKTPNFSEIPNLEKLVLKNCTSLVEVHKSIGLLDRLVLLDCEDYKSLRNLPKSICLLKHLETLIISGCSNLDGLPTNMENMESLTVLEIDRIALNQSRPTIRQANLVQSFIWPWRLKARESAEISWPSLPQSLVKLRLENCNLSEDDFPRDLSNLCSLKELNLSYNQFCSLPDFFRDLAKLKYFYINSCPRLRKLDKLPILNGRLDCGANRALEEVTFQSSHRPETLSLFKLESIDNVEAEIVNNLGLSNFQSMGNLTVKLTSWMGMQRRRFPLQVCYQRHIISAYIPGSTVPPGFTFKNLGSAIDFIVPSYLNSRIRGLNVCSVYVHFGDPKHHEPHTIISNRTKGLVWSDCPFVFGTAEDGEDTMWLSYWKFGNHLESGDELNISVSGGEFVQIKEVGVRVLYKEEPEEMSTQSAYGDKLPHQLYQFGNIVPGIVSAHLPGIKLYQLGYHLVDCKYCKHLYPPPWIPAPYEFDYNLECWASVLMMGEPFYVSQDHGR
ncbi:hypothetical protein RHMOL_Rhmol05G0222000 [Rhododendron molle]|uniref:Uncharacterized protein n=1 Tax=Rhododendron molle TaxID=49168 RepID=A0ACC0NT50_RHOML|nr:hypothetical protein RHMOL_Rhmol05G0222000 [Rhododendron molle]